jgi:hypothetical protein
MDVGKEVVGQVDPVWRDPVPGPGKNCSEWPSFSSGTMSNRTCPAIAVDRDPPAVIAQGTLSTVSQTTPGSHIPIDGDSES